MSKTGRFYVITPDGRTFCVEPIDNSQGKGKERWGDIDPATKKLTGNYDGKYVGSIHEDESIITEENGFKNIVTLPPGTSPMGYINDLVEKESMKIIINGRDVRCSKKTLSYEDVVRISGQRYHENLIYSISYHHRGKNLDGTLIPNKSINIEEGMIFNAHVTDNA